MSELRRRVGRRIAELRHERGLTQQDLAERLGWTSWAYVARVEGGTKNVSIDTLERIADALHVQAAALFVDPVSLHVRRGRPVGRRGR